MKQTPLTAAIAALLLFEVAFLNSAVGQATSNDALWRWTKDSDHHRSVVQVSLDGAHGTGVLVRIDRALPKKSGFVAHVLTAFHVVEPDNDRNEIEVRFADGTIAKNASVVEYDRQHDIALITTWAPPEAEPAKTATAPAANKAFLEIVGLGGGAEPGKSLRHFSSRATQPTTEDVIYADATLLPGDSGGPIFNRKRELIGIVSGGWFWWNSGATSVDGSPILSTWPARASNLRAINRILDRTGELNVASR